MMIQEIAKYLVSGSSVRRKKWIEGEYLIIRKDMFGNDEIFYHTPFNMLEFYWMPIPEDLLADDWEIV